MKFSPQLKVEACAAHDVGRYAMHGVAVERDASADTEETPQIGTDAKGAPILGDPIRTLGARAIATDGRKLVVVPCTLEPGDEVHGQIIPREAFKLARKVAGARKPAAIAVNGAISAAGETFAPLVGEFPRYRAVLADVNATDYVLVTLDADYLAEVFNAIAPVDSDGRRTVTLAISRVDAKAPVALAGGRAGAEIGAGVGVVMPIVADDGSDHPAALARFAWARSNATDTEGAPHK